MQCLSRPGATLIIHNVICNVFSHTSVIYNVKNNFIYNIIHQRHTVVFSYNFIYTVIHQTYTMLNTPVSYTASFISFIHQFYSQFYASVIYNVIHQFYTSVLHISFIHSVIQLYTTSCSRLTRAVILRAAVCCRSPSIVRHVARLLSSRAVSNPAKLRKIHYRKQCDIVLRVLPQIILRRAFSDIARHVHFASSFS